MCVACVQVHPCGVEEAGVVERIEAAVLKACDVILLGAPACDGSATPGARLDAAFCEAAAVMEGTALLRLVRDDLGLPSATQGGTAGRRVLQTLVSEKLLCCVQLIAVDTCCEEPGSEVAVVAVDAALQDAVRFAGPVVG
jgi:hypothetical protein